MLRYASIGLLCLLCSSPALAATPDSAWFQTLSETAHASPLEGAGAQGGSGFTLGTGAQSVPVTEEQRTIAEETLGEKLRMSSLVLPKLWLSKALFYPLDIGFNVGRLSSALTQIGGYTQLTVFEAYRSPALTLRASHGRLLGLEGGMLESSSAEAVLGWGLGPLSAYAGWGRSMTLGRLGAGSPREQLWTNSRSVGLCLLLLPSLARLTVERHQSGTHLSYAAKLSMGL